MSISAASPAYASSSPHTHIRVMVVDEDQGTVLGEVQLVAVL